MARLIKPLTRTGQKARIALAAPAKAGKTYTALQWAEVFEAAEIANGGRGGILGIDTERGEMGLYTDKFSQADGSPIQHMRWDPPFDSEELGQTIIDYSKTVAVIVVDSGSHFWRGEGGVLNLVDEVSQRNFGGNKYAGWTEGTKVQDFLVSAITRAECHVIFTMRSKMAYVLETNAKGKEVPKRVGLEPVQREDVEYEFTVLANMDQGHNVEVTGTRCDLLDGRHFPKAKTAELAEILSKWLLTAEPLITADQLTEIAAAGANVGTEAEITACRAEFRLKFGPSTQLTASDVPKALAFIAEWSPREDSLPGDEAAIAAQAIADAKAAEIEGQRSMDEAIKEEATGPSPEELEEAADQMRAEKEGTAPRGAKKTAAKKQAVPKRGAAKKATAKKATAKKGTKKAPKRTSSGALKSKAAKAPRDMPIPDEGEPWGDETPTQPNEGPTPQNGSLTEQKAEEIRQQMLRDWARLKGDDSVKVETMLGQFNLWPIEEIPDAKVEQADSIMSAVLDAANEGATA